MPTMQPARILVAGLLVACGLVAVSLAGNFAGQDLRNQSFVGMKLDGSDFTNADARGARFDRANLRKTIWLQANLENAMLNGADLTDADLRGVKGPFFGEQMDFTRANLKGVNLAGFGCNGCEFGGADLRRTRNWGAMSEANFRKADLRGADLRTMTTRDPTNLAGFIGAVYDDATQWPPWVDVAKVRARKVALDDEPGEPLPTAPPATNGATGSVMLGAYECVFWDAVDADISPNGHPDNIGGTKDGYPISIGEPRPGMNFTLADAGVYIDADGSHGTFVQTEGGLVFAGGILDAIRAVVFAENGNHRVLFEALQISCQLVTGPQ